MPRFILTLLTAVLVAVSASPSLAKPKAKSIVDVAQKAGIFDTLLTAATAAGFADDLSKVDGLTVLAPTDDAFAKLPPGTLDDLLKPENQERLRAIIAYHIIPDEVRSKQISKRYKLVETLNGCERVLTKRTGKGVKVDGVDVIKADVRAKNGYIHIIDEVLLPARNCP